MGLFSRSKSDETIVNVRDDISDALDALPPKELEFIAHVCVPELEFMSEFIRPNEEVVAIACCHDMGNGDGVIAYTEKRVVAVIGRRDKRRNVVGTPTVINFPFKKLTSLTFATSKQWCIGYFDMPDQARLTLNIGYDRDWSIVFMDAMKEQYNWKLR